MNEFDLSVYQTAPASTAPFADFMRLLGLPSLLLLAAISSPLSLVYVALVGIVLLQLRYGLKAYAQGMMISAALLLLSSHSPTPQGALVLTMIGAYLCASVASCSFFAWLLTKIETD